MLTRLRVEQTDRLTRLWTAGLILIAVEGFARIIYQGATTSPIHNATHVVALEAYLFAGFAFLVSPTVTTRTLVTMDLYGGLICNVLLFAVYGSGMQVPWIVNCLGVGFLTAAAIGALWYRSESIGSCFYLTTLFPPGVALLLGDERVATYLSLSALYGFVSVMFFVNLPAERRGRIVLVVGFATWSLCFLFHPWIARNHVLWTPMANEVWDLQKFIVMFGLLLLTLENRSAHNEHQALHDELTSLPNRRLFSIRLDQEIARAKRKQEKMALFAFDLNGFKQVNDTLGHEAGDLLLKDISARLAAVTRVGDTLARIGGDEFQLLLPDFRLGSDSASCSPSEGFHERAEAIARKFRDIVQKRSYSLNCSAGTHVIKASASVGFAIYPDDASESQSLCEVADRRMYADKRLIQFVVHDVQADRQ